MDASPGTKSTSAGLNDQFYKQFQLEITGRLQVNVTMFSQLIMWTALQDQVDGINKISNVGGERIDAIEHCRAGITRLTRDVQDASGYLPSYDQRAYTEV